MKIILFAISHDDWNSIHFSAVSQQAKDSARKILKEIDVGLERKRFNNSCNRIETLTLKHGKQIYISEQNIQRLLNGILLNSPILLPFIEYDKLKDFINFFDDKALNYINRIQATIVFIVCEFSQGGVELESDNVDVMQEKNTTSNVDDLNTNALLTTDEIQKRFHGQIIDAIKTGNPVGWINVESENKDDNSSRNLIRHEGIISCLREHLFIPKHINGIDGHYSNKANVSNSANESNKEQELPKALEAILRFLGDSGQNIVHDKIVPRFIQFAFRDGSISEVFPLYCLEDTGYNDKLPKVKVALISNRHPELDNIVETCLLRNSEISRREEATISDQEKLSFGIAFKFFNEILEKRSNGVNIELYHTGLEPAVIGTYRAFLATISKLGNRGKLVITPKIPKSDREFRNLKSWY